MTRKVFLTQIPDTATQSEVEKIFKGRLKDYCVSLSKGKIKGTQIGTLSWNDDVSDLEIMKTFRGTAIDGGRLEMKVFDPDYFKNKRQHSDRDLRTFSPKTYNDENNRVSAQLGIWLDAIVTNYASYDHFHVQLANNSSDLEEVSQVIREDIDNCTVITSQIDAIIGYIYAAPYSDDNNWYRVKVLSHLDNDKVLVEFIDYGNEQTVFFSQLRILRRALSAKPRFAHYCRLYNVEANAYNAHELDVEFKQHWINKPCKIRIGYIQKPVRRFDLEVWHVEIKGSDERDFIRDMVSKKLLKLINPGLNYFSMSNFSSKSENLDQIKDERLVSREKTSSPHPSERDFHQQLLEGAVPSSTHFEDSFPPLQVNNSSVMEKVNVIVREPIPVKILKTNPEKMEIALRFLDPKHKQEYMGITKTLKTLYDKKGISPLRLGSTVNLNQTYLAESSEKCNTVCRIRILRPTSNAYHEHLIPSTSFGQFATVYFIDIGSQEQKEISNGKVKDVYGMPSENDLCKFIGKSDAEAVMKCPPLAKICHLAWDRFSLELPAENKNELSSEMSLLSSRSNLQAKFNENDQWIDFLYSENERTVAWKDHLVAKGILNVSSINDHEEDYQPINHPEIMDIAKTLQGAVYQHTGRVTYISHTAEVYVRLYDDLKSYQTIANWENNIIISEIPVTSPVQQYAMYGTANGGKSKRFQALHVSVENPERVYGQFIDYGTTHWTSTKDLFMLPTKLMKMKPLAQKFVLDSVIGQVVDGNEFKTRLDREIFNAKVTIVGRKDSENSLTSLTTLNGPGIHFVNMYTQMSNLYFFVSDLIRRELMAQLMEHSMIYRILFSSQLEDKLKDLCKEPDVLVEAQKQSQDLKEIRRKFIQNRTRLANEIEMNHDATLETIKPLVKERQCLAESIVSTGSRASSSPNSTDEGEKKRWSDRLKEIQKALNVIQKIMKIFSAEEGDTSSDNQFTYERVLQEFLSPEDVNQLKDLWRLTDEARAALEKVSMELTQILSMFSPVGAILLNIPNFGQNVIMPDIRINQYLQQWYDCLSSEVSFAAQLGLCKKEEIVASVRAILVQLKQHHTSIIDVLNNPIANVIRSAHALLQPQDNRELISYLDNFPLLIRKANAKLLRLQATIMEMESNEVDTLKELEEEEKLAVNNIQTLWLEQAQKFDKIIKHCELRPELQLLHPEFQKICKKGVVCTWDTRLIKRRQTGLQNDLFTATFADKTVLIQEYRKVPSTISLKEYLHGYHDICDTNQEGTFLPIMAMYRSSLMESNENDSILLSVNVMFEAPNDDLALCLNPCNVLEPHKLQHILEELTLANVHKLLWNAIQALEQLFHAEELSATSLPLCWLVRDDPKSDQIRFKIADWKLCMAPPSLPLNLTDENLQMTFENKMRWNLCKFSELLGVDNRKEFGWFNSWISSDAFSLTNAADVFRIAEPKADHLEYANVSASVNNVSGNSIEQNVDVSLPEIGITLTSEMLKTIDENNEEIAECVQHEDDCASNVSDISVD